MYDNSKYQEIWSWNKIENIKLPKTVYKYLQKGTYLLLNLNSAKTEY